MTANGGIHGSGAVADVGSKPESPSRIYGVVLGVGVLCSLAIVSTYEATRPIIAKNRSLQRQRAILEVLPEAESIEPLRYDEGSGRFEKAGEDTDEEELVFAGLNASGELVGMAVGASGMGYQDTIELLYGYQPSEQAVTGIRVLESRETPGLGDRIETDPEFQKNFEHLDVRVSEDGLGLAHEIEFVKPGEKTEPWQIDGITGATISSRAVAEMLRQSTRRWVPRMRPTQGSFGSTVGGEGSP